jgi:catalase
MAMINPKGRANYEPNSWDGERGGPRESPEKGFHSYASAEEGQKLRVRPETFADHYSQARRFYISQTETEQNHIAGALIFELSKVERLEIHSRMVSHLLNIHAKLAKQVLRFIAADGFRRSRAGKLTRNQKRASFVEVTRKQVQPVSLHTR